MTYNKVNGDLQHNYVVNYLYKNAFKCKKCKNAIKSQCKNEKKTKKLDKKLHSCYK